MEYTLAYKSPNGKIRTEARERRFAIGEELKNGSLVTLFDENGNVLDQKRFKTSVEESVESYIGPIKIVESEYKSVEVNAVCPKCGKRSIKRELDIVDTKKLENVPEVPVYVCTSCGHAFYSITKEYLRKLAKEHAELFTEEEEKEREKDEEAFVNELNEYIIRIFASKKIMRIEIGK
ncbi:MAG: hypothetical protein ACP5HW_02475 [Candidatus Micrarchaeia archaeon]|jgi:DNA-directed RNA polymerase subunit M/transcription elongation factor TFIIS